MASGSQWQKVTLLLVMLGLIFSFVSGGSASAGKENSIEADTIIYMPVVYKGFLMATSGFSSDFNSNKVGWLEQNGEWQVDTAYYWTEGIAGSSVSSAAYEDYAFDNFDFQVMMERLGCKTCVTRIIVRGLPTPLGGDGSWYHGYEFQYTRDGTFSVSKWVYGMKTVLQPWVFSTAIAQNDAWNQLRVVANGPSLTFYINGTQVWTGSDSSLMAGHVGVGFYRDSGSTGNKLLVDWATLTILSP